MRAVLGELIVATARYGSRTSRIKHQRMGANPKPVEEAEDADRTGEHSDRDEYLQRPD